MNAGNNYINWKHLQDPSDKVVYIVMLLNLLYRWHIQFVIQSQIKLYIIAEHCKMMYTVEVV